MIGARVRHVLSLLVRTAVMYLCYFPVVLIVGHFVLDGRTALLLAVLFGGSFAGILVGLVPLKIWLEVLIALVLSGTTTYGVFGMEPRSFLVFALMYGVIHLGLRSAQYNPEEGLPSRVVALGLAAWLTIPVLYRVDPLLREQAALHSAVAVAAVAAAFFLMNRTQLFFANLQDRTGPRGVSPDIRLKNALYAAGLLAAVVAVANIKAISLWLDALRDAFAAWLAGLGAEPGEFEPEPAMPGEMSMLPIEVDTREPSPFWEMLQQIFIYLVSGLSILAFLALAGYLVVVKLYPFLKTLLIGLNRERQPNLDYLDETEKLEAPDLRATLRRAVGRFARRRPALPEDGRERVRLRYRMMLEEAARDGLGPDAALTPAETADKLEAAGWRKRPATLLVRLYNPVRYGEKDVDPAQLAELERAWDNRRERG